MDQPELGLERHYPAGWVSKCFDLHGSHHILSQCQLLAVIQPRSLVIFKGLTHRSTLGSSVNPNWVVKRDQTQPRWVNECLDPYGLSQTCGVTCEVLPLESTGDKGPDRLYQRYCLNIYHIKDWTLVLFMYVSHACFYLQRLSMKSELHTFGSDYSTALNRLLMTLTCCVISCYYRISCTSSSQYNYKYLVKETCCMLAKLAMHSPNLGFQAITKHGHNMEHMWTSPYTITTTCHIFDLIYSQHFYVFSYNHNFTNLYFPLLVYTDTGASKYHCNF